MARDRRRTGEEPDAASYYDARDEDLLAELEDEEDEVEPGPDDDEDDDTLDPDDWIL